jgi:hypothetical protein
MDLGEVSCESVAWIQQAQWQPCVKAVLNFDFRKSRIFLNQPWSEWVNWFADYWFDVYVLKIKETFFTEGRAVVAQSV